MKKILTTIVFLSFFATLLPNLAFARCGIVDTGFTSLNIRSRSSERSRIIAKVNKGSALRIINRRGYWVKVKLNNGRIGYASRDYISSGSCAIVRTRSGKLNIRRRPTARSRVVGRASRGSAVSILNQTNYWARVLLNNGQIGYASRDYIY